MLNLVGGKKSSKGTRRKVKNESDDDDCRSLDNDDGKYGQACRTSA